MLELLSVTTAFRDGTRVVQALQDVTLQVSGGELVAVMGPSGSGKSTLLSVAGLLKKPNAGTVRISGDDASQLSSAARARIRRRTIGFVFQAYNLIESLSALENVSLPLELDGWSRRDANEAALGALGEVELSALTDAYPEEMSGGQRQRVAIARAIVGERDLILADEPTGALDSSAGDEVMRVLRRQVDEGSGGLLVTHDARHLRWADRVVVLRDGRVVAAGVPGDQAVADALAVR